MDKKLINHVIFAIDNSGSMQSHVESVKRVMKNLFQEVSSSAFETHISFYSFNNRVECLLKDAYEFRVENRKVVQTSAPSLPEIPPPSGLTALIDAAGVAITDHLGIERGSAPDEDRTFLLYVITDGGENASRQFTAPKLRSLVEGLSDSWTIATMVPNSQGVHYAKMCGFPAGNIQMWDTTSATAFEDAGQVVKQSFTAYATMRSTGVRSTSNLFQVDASNISKKDVKANLQKIDGRIYVAQKEYQIRDFVEKMTKVPYVKGSAYYELLKTEELQPQKQIVIVPKKNKDGIKYGGDSARDMLGLPRGQYVKIKPGDFGDWRIFVQSTSVNRKITPGVAVLVV